MIRKGVLLWLSMLVLLLSPVAIRSQLPVDVHPAKIYEILDPAGRRLGSLVVAGVSERGYQEGTESWRFSEPALLEIADHESLSFKVWAAGAWEDPWVVESLAWRPEGSVVEWTHPAEVAWTPQSESPPPVVAGGTYFGDPTLGGLVIRYEPLGTSSLTWFKLTSGPFLQLEDGAVFDRQEDAPTTGEWWHGPIRRSTR